MEQPTQLSMKQNACFKFLLLAGLILGLPVCRADAGPEDKYPPQVLSFSADKERQVQDLARNLGISVPAEIGQFFKSATRGDYSVVSNTIARLAPEYATSYQKKPENLPAWIPFWQPMCEVEGAYTAFAAGGPKYPLAFGNGIARSIPKGSIYFGGTDAGRSLVSALCESHVEAKPFYTLTQNALSDRRYLDYLQSMYGTQINLPTTNEVQKAIDEYKADALLRLKHDREFPNAPRQLKQGENVRLVAGEVQLDNAVSVMAIHARLVKVILDRNPKPDFYMEESHPLDLLYAHLSPHGLIFKLNHEPVRALTAAVLDADNAFWTKECHPILGSWMKPDISISNLCEFAKSVYGQKNWSLFTGDRAYVTNEFATKAFSKLRVSIAGLYQWRLMNQSSADDPTRLKVEAHYAFRQAFALCPSSPEVVYRYVGFLMSQNEILDAIQLVDTARSLAPDNRQFEVLLSQLRNQRR